MTSAGSDPDPEVNVRNSVSSILDSVAEGNAVAPGVSDFERDDLVRTSVSVPFALSDELEAGIGDIEESTGLGSGDEGRL